MQIRGSRPSRAERSTTSCSECRRRKQRCDQGQPCSNCVRRFPQPVCEYRPTPSRPPRPADSPTFVVSTLLPSPSLIDRDIFEYAGIDQPLLPLRPGHVEHVSVDPELLRQPQTFWSGDRPCSGLGAGDLIRWSGIDILTQFPGPSSWEALPWMNVGASGGGTPLEGLGLYSPLCHEGCEVHQLDLAHDWARQSVTSRFIPADWNLGRTEELASWLLTLDASARTNSPGPRDHTLPEGQALLGSIPMSATRQNSELLAIFAKQISRFKCYSDGITDANGSPSIKFYVPFCVQTPLLAQVATYTASCFLTETGRLDATVTMAHKGLAIRMLNELLRGSKSSASDEAMTAVIQLILDEWYWGDVDVLRAHLRGLREMIRLRGGLRSLGMNGLVAKLAIAADVAIALSFELSPFLPRRQEGKEKEGDKDRDGACESAEFDFRETNRVPFRVAYNTPLVASLASFDRCAEALGLHPTTANMLDDMRFLISRVLGMPDRPSEAELRKLGATAGWILGRIEKLPTGSPCERRPGGDEGGTAFGASASLALDGRDRTSPVSDGGKKKSPWLRPDHNQRVTKSTSPAPFPSRFSPELPPQASSSFAAPSSSSSSSSSSPSSSPEPPDFLYQAVRRAALLYCRAVMQRQPFSAVVSPQELRALWSTVCRVPLARWKSVLGVFGWVVVAMASCCSSPGSFEDDDNTNNDLGNSNNNSNSLSPPPQHDGRFVKSLLTIWTVQMCLDNWEIASGALRSALRLQAWLAGPGEEDRGAGGGGDAEEGGDAGRVKVEGAYTAAGEASSSSSAGRGGGDGGGLRDVKEEDVEVTDGWAAQAVVGEDCAEVDEDML